MNALKKFVSLLLAVIMVLGTVSSSALAGYALPGALVDIQKEAFLGNSAMEGLIVLPETVRTVGENAFASTGVHALAACAGVESIGSQNTTMAYLVADSASTRVEGSGWARIAIAPEGSQVQLWAESNGVTFVPGDSVVSYEGFLYKVADGKAELLCPVDDTAIGAEVILPETVGEYKLSALSENAFFGCAQVRTISVPAGVTAAQGAYDGCPDAEVTIAPADHPAPVVEYFSQGETILFGKWQVVEGAVSYEMARVTDEGYVVLENPVAIKENMYSLNSEFANGANIGVMHYAVRAVFEDGSTSAWSDSFEICTLGKTEATGRQTGLNAFTLEWKAVENAETYMITFIGQDGSSKVEAKDATGTSYVVELPEDADRTAVYTYRVYACNATGNGEGSERVVFNGLSDLEGTQIVLGVNAISLNNANRSAQLTAEVISSALEDKSVRYSVLDPYIASVDQNGLVTGKGNGMTYVYVTAADGTTVRCPVTVDMKPYVVSLANVPQTATQQDGFWFSLVVDGEYEPVPNEWVSMDVTWFDADGGVLDCDSWGFEMDESSENFHMYCAKSGVASVELRLTSSQWFVPGENNCAVVEITGDNASETSYYVEFTSFSYYPGSKFQVYVSADAPGALTSPVTVKLQSDDGLINETLGTLTSDAPVLRSVATIPASWQYGEAHDVALICDDSEITRYYVEISGLYAWDCYVTVGETLEFSQADYCEIASELPLAFAVEDESIAVIGETGSVTGLKAGQTTATVTTQRGSVKSFTIYVSEPSSGETVPEPQGIPTLFLYAPKAQMNYDSHYWNEYFIVAPEIPGTLTVDQSYPVQLTFYNADMEEIGSESTGVYVDDVNYASFWFCPGEYADLDIHYVRAEITESELNKVSSPVSAMVEVVYPEEEEDTEALVFEEILSEYVEYAPGATVEIPVTCLTPERIDETAQIRAVVIGGRAHVASVSALALTPEAPSGNILVQVDEQAVQGSWVTIYLYYGGTFIGEYQFRIRLGLSLLINQLYIHEGEERTMPITLPDGVTMDSVVFTPDNPAIATVDENGVIHAHQVGNTRIRATYVNEFGFDDYVTLRVYVQEALEEGLPVMSMAPKASSAKFGAAIPLTFTLDKVPAVEELPARVTMALLDENKSMFTQGQYWLYIMPQEGVTTYEASLTSWPRGGDLSKTRYVYLSFQGDASEAANYAAQESNYLLDVTDLPEAGELVYSMEPTTEPPYRVGNTLRLRLMRMSITGEYPQETCELRTGDGTVVYSGTISENSTALSARVNTASLTPASTHTLVLYVNGEETNCTFTFYLEEPSLSVNVNSRMQVGLQYNITASFPAMTDYTTGLTYGSDDQSVLTVDENGTITTTGIGMTNVWVQTTAGQKVSVPVIVYDPYNLKAPEFYLIPSTYDVFEEYEWFGGLTATLGTTTELYYVSGGMHPSVLAEFLDADGNVMTSCTASLYHGMVNAEYDSTIYLSDTAWQTAFLAGAKQVRVTLSLEGSDTYTIDDTRKTLVYELQDVSEYAYPVVNMTYTANVAPQGTFRAVFTCINPASLGEGREASITNPATDEVVAQGLLTPEAPELTLTWQLPEDWSSGSEVLIRTPSRSESGTNQGYYRVYLSAVTRLSDENLHIQKDRTSNIYAYYSGTLPALNWSVADESIATVSYTEGKSYATVTGVSAGVTQVILTTENGDTFSANVVVYDPDNSELAVLWLDQSQNGQVLPWSGSVPVGVCTSTEPQLMSAKPYCGLQLDYLDANGEWLYSLDVSGSVSGLFLDGTEHLDVTFDADKAYAAGARSVLVTLKPMTGYYTLAEDNLQVTFVLDDPALQEEPLFVLDAYRYYIRGSEYYTGAVTCINPEAMNGDYTVYVMEADQGDIENFILNSETPSRTFQVPAADKDYLQVSIRVEHDVESNRYMSLYCNAQTMTVEPLTVAKGSTVSTGYSLPAGPVYTITDPTIATVSANGYVTGVNAGVTTITVQAGRLKASAPVRVYDGELTQTAALTLDTAEGCTAWPWVEEQGESRFVIRADQPLENLGASATATVNVTYCTEDGTQVGDAADLTCELVFAGGNSEEFTLTDGLYSYRDMTECAYNGVTKAVLKITYVSGGSFSYDPETVLEIPMIPLEETADPMFFIESDLKGELVAGRNYTVTLKAGNRAQDKQYVVTLKTPDYASSLSLRDGGLNYRPIQRMAYNPAQTASLDYTFAIPEDLLVENAYLYLYYYYAPADDADNENFIIGYRHTMRYEAEACTTLAQLQSAHNYGYYSRNCWTYTVAGATSLNVTFDAKTKLQSSSDYLYVGTAEQLENNSFTTANRYGGTTLASQTVTVEGDTLALKLTSNGSSNYWGFAVTQIQATMEDGSVVTITE